MALVSKDNPIVPPTAGSGRNLSLAKPVAGGIINAAAAALGRVITGANTEWFGPLNPIPAVAQQVQGRTFDYPVGININYQPKAYDSDGISYQQLRALADSCDPLRIGIEKLKDQLCKAKWSCKPKDGDADPDDRCKQVDEFFLMPDRVRPYKTWLRVLAEDLLVIDAPTIYPRRTNGGKLFSLDVMDGSLVKVLIDPSGRRPMTPQPAYQQILHGVPAVDYSADQLFFMPMNPRSNKLYGYSKVEQILLTVNTSIRRAIYQLKYYTSGTIPEGFLEAPASWQQDQIIKFQEYMDRMLAGDLDRRNQALVVANGMKFAEAKQPILKDESDEWFVRLICGVLGIAPTPFVKQMNRATAATAKETADEEGVEPLKEWTKAMIDFVIATVFGWPDLELQWDQNKDTDPLVQAQINSIMVGQKPVLTVNEVRAELGYEPMKVDENADPNDQLAGAPVDADNENPEDEDQVESGEAEGKVVTKAHKKKVLYPKHEDAINRDTRTQRARVKKFTATLTDAFADDGAHTVKVVIRQYSALSKADTDKDADNIADNVNLSWFDKLVTKVRVLIRGSVEDGATQAFTQIAADPTPSMVDQVHEQGVKYADDRAAEMVGKQWIGNVLVDNPNAEWAISESTREFIRDAVSDAIKNGDSPANLAKKLMSRAFSPARARMIARTEMLNANVKGNMNAYRASGTVHGKRWILGEEPCDICKDNSEQGIIPLDDNFQSGDDAPPAHPHCVCDVLPITDINRIGDKK